MSWIRIIGFDVFTRPVFPSVTPELVGPTCEHHKMLFLKNGLLGLAFHPQVATMGVQRQSRTIVYKVIAASELPGASPIKP